MRFKVADLLQSGFHEDTVVAKRAEETIQEIIGELKPVLKYITKPFHYLNTDSYTGAGGRCHVHGDSNDTHAVRVAKLDLTHSHNL